MKAPDYLIVPPHRLDKVKSWIVWNGWEGKIVACPETFTHKDIVASGTTPEAAEAAKRLLDS